MNRRTARDTWTAKLLLVACFFAPVAPALPAEPEPEALTSDFEGKVFGTDGQAAAGVKVMTYHLATGGLFSATTDADSKFTLLELPLGYYDMAARSADGLYVADQVMQVSATGKNFVALQLKTLGGSAQADIRAFAGANEAPVGLAVVMERDGRAFWASPKGISILAAGGALVLLAFPRDSDPPASPSFP